MPLTSPSESALPAAWTDVLDRIQRVLADALQAAEARAQALEGDGEVQRMKDVEFALAGAADSAEQCEKLTAETERILASSQEALDRWLATAAQVGQRLAEQAGRAV